MKIKFKKLAGINNVNKATKREMKKRLAQKRVVLKLKMVPQHSVFNSSSASSSTSLQRLVDP